MTYITNLYPDPSCHKQSRVLDRSATPALWLEVSSPQPERKCCARYESVFPPVGRGTDPNRRTEESGRVVVVAYTATSGLRVIVENGMTLVSGTTPSEPQHVGEDQRGRQPQHLLQWQWQFDVGGLGRVRGRRMADRPTTPPPVPVVRRRLDAPAVIGGERR